MRKIKNSKDEVNKGHKIRQNLKQHKPPELQQNVLFEVTHNSFDGNTGPGNLQQNSYQK